MIGRRARRRVKGVDATPDADRTRQRHVVDAYLAATRAGDFQALVELLDPDVVLRADRDVVPTRSPIVMRGSRAVAKGAMASIGRAQSTQPVLVNGTVGLVMAESGRVAVVLRFSFNQDKITDIEVIAEQDRLGQLELSILDN